MSSCSFLWEYSDRRSLHIKIWNPMMESANRGKLSYVNKLREIIHEKDKNIWYNRKRV